VKFRRNKTAAILGCGPAGLFAAHALVEKGWKVTIFSRKRRSEMFGAQYLHKPIPGLTEGPATTVEYKLIGGTAEAYREKVYGRRSGISVSPEELGQAHSAWDIRQTYHKAWEMYADLIQPTGIITSGWAWNLADSRDYREVISTLPGPDLCEGPEEHMFDSEQVWAVGDAPERGVFCPVTEAAPFQILCNASRDSGWYRNANVFGYRTAEWPGGRRPPLDGVASVTKPISTNCDCQPNILRLGRYGEWRKGVLSHEAYEKAAAL
jgi:hypothetical protein